MGSIGVADDLQRDVGVWSLDPHEQVVQLTRQVKIARGQLDKKSDLCDELAEQLRILEKELELRTKVVRECKDSLSAAEEKFRAAEDSAAEKEHNHAERLLSFDARVRSLESETNSAQLRVSAESIIAEGLRERLHVVELQAAKMEEKATECAAELSRMTIALVDEGVAAEALSSKYTHSTQEIQAWSVQLDVEETACRTLRDESAIAQQIEGREAAACLRAGARTEEVQAKMAAAERALRHGRAEQASISELLESCESKLRIRVLAEETEVARASKMAKRLKDFESTSEEVLSTVEMTHALHVKQFAAEIDELRSSQSALCREVCEAIAEAAAETTAASAAKGSHIACAEELAISTNQLAQHRLALTEAVAKVEHETASCVAAKTASQELEAARVAMLRVEEAHSVTVLLTKHRQEEHREEFEQFVEHYELAETKALERSKQFHSERDTFEHLIMERDDALQALRDELGEEASLRKMATNREDAWTIEVTCHRDGEMAAQQEVESQALEAAAKAALAATVLETVKAELVEQTSLLRLAHVDACASAEGQEAEAAALAIVRSELHTSEATCTQHKVDLQEVRAKATATQTLVMRQEDESTEARAQAAAYLCEVKSLLATGEDLRRVIDGAEHVEAQLRTDLRDERLRREMALKLADDQRIAFESQLEQLREELCELSTELENKEDEILNSKFETVTLQNTLKEHVKELVDSSEAMRMSNIAVDEKDRKLNEVMRRQEELLVQMNESTSKLQDKVTQLSGELERSQTAHKTLDQQTRAVITRLEAERDKLNQELSFARSEVLRLTQLVETFASAQEICARLRGELRDYEESAESLQNQHTHLENTSRELRCAHVAQVEGHEASRIELQEKLCMHEEECVFRVAGLEAQASQQVRLSEQREAHLGGKFTLCHEELTEQAAHFAGAYEKFRSEFSALTDEHSVAIAQFNVSKNEWKLIEQSEQEHIANLECNVFQEAQRELSQASEVSDLARSLQLEQAMLETIRSENSEHVSARQDLVAHQMELQRRLEAASAALASVLIQEQKQCGEHHEVVARLEANLEELEDVTAGFRRTAEEDRVALEEHLAREESSCVARRDEYAASLRRIGDENARLQVEERSFVDRAFTYREEHHAASLRVESLQGEHRDERRRAETYFELHERCSVDYGLAEARQVAEIAKLMNALTLQRTNCEVLERLNGEHISASEEISFALQASREHHATLLDRHEAALEVSMVTSRGEGLRSHEQRLALLQMEAGADTLERELSSLRDMTAEQASHLAELRARLELSSESHALREANLRESQEEAAVLASKLAEDSSAQLQRSEEKVLTLESQALEAARGEARKLRELRESLRVMGEKYDNAESLASDRASALERSRLLERQALERAQELRQQVALLREFGLDDFMQTQPASLGEFAPATRKKCSTVDDKLGSVISAVLIEIDLNLGAGRIATLSVAPWHSRADFESLVKSFLDANQVKPLFQHALVQYLVDVEAEADTFPVRREADLADLYARYG